MIHPRFTQPMKHTFLAFTLAELLIALGILAVIATFTIPKVLESSQNQQKNATTKEFIAMVSAIYQSLETSGQLSSATRPDDFTPYMNYINVSNISVDERPGLDDATCGSLGYKCLKLANGGVVFWLSGHYFSGTGNTNAIWIGFDPDGTYSSSPTGSGKAVKIWIYYNGRITSYANIQPNACDNGGCSIPNASYDPDWFSWN